MTTRLRWAGPLGRLLHPTALVMAGFLAAFWPGRRRTGTRQSVLPSHADQRLRTSEAILDNAATLCHVGAWQVKLPAMQLTWSRELCVILEVAADHPLSLEELMAFYLPTDGRLLYAALENCAATGQAVVLDLRLVTARHRLLLVKVAGEAVRDATGRITHIQGALQDISASRAERSQLLVANRLLTTLETISDGVVTFDADCRFTYVNAQAERLLQRKRGALMGHQLREVFPGGPDASLERHCQQALAHRRPSHFEDFYEPEGLWLDVSVYPSEEGLAVYFRDVTERRAERAELALLKTAIARINDMVVITEAEPIDAPGPRIVYVNDAFERRSGYSRAEVLGKSPRILQGPHASRAELNRIRHALVAGQPVRAEVVNYTKAGDAYWLELDISPITDASGRRTHFVAVQRDVTERHASVEEIVRLNRELEDRVSQRTAQLEAVNKELQAFSASVSHDLRGPLTALDGFSALLAKREAANFSDKGTHYLNRIRSSAAQMGELIDGLLALARTANEPVVRVPVDLSALAHRMARECLERNTDQRAAFHIDEDMTVNADALLMSVVLHNLVGNACKFTSKTPHPEVTIGCQPGAAGQPVYFVKDNGAGFDQAHADKLFAIFQRLHNPSDFAGTGIGLVNVKRAVERHGGTVWAKGKVGEGATFYFTLG